jgi:hypothetical protein
VIGIAFMIAVRASVQSMRQLEESESPRRGSAAAAAAKKKKRKKKKNAVGDWRATRCSFLLAFLSSNDMAHICAAAAHERRLAGAV